MAALVRPWVAVARRAANEHVEREARQPGAGAWWRECAMRSRATVALLERVEADGLAGDARDVVLLAVPGDRLGDALEALSLAGVPCEPAGEGHTSGGIGTMVGETTMDGSDQ